MNKGWPKGVKKAEYAAWKAAQAGTQAIPTEPAVVDPISTQKVLTSLESLAKTPVVNDVVPPVTGRFKTYDDPEELAARFVFKGGPQLQLTAEFKDPNFHSKWFPYFAYDQNGDGSTLQHKLAQSYVFVTKDEVMNFNNGLTPTNDALDNRICITGRNGDRHYLMKCPLSVAQKIWASEEAVRAERDALMRAGKTPDGKDALTEKDGHFVPTANQHKAGLFSKLN